VIGRGKRKAEELKQQLDLLKGNAHDPKAGFCEKVQAVISEGPIYPPITNSASPCWQFLQVQVN